MTPPVPPTNTVYQSSRQPSFSAGYQFALGNGRVLYVAGKTDIGTSRTKNEDNFLLCGPLLVVADGVGSYPTSEASSWIACAAMKMYGLRHDPPRVVVCRTELEQYIQQTFGADAHANTSNAVSNMTRGILDGSYNIAKVCTENTGSIESILYIMGLGLSLASPKPVKMGTTIAVADFSATGAAYYHQGDSGIAYRVGSASPKLLTPLDFVMEEDLKDSTRQRKRLTACLGRWLLKKRDVLQHDSNGGTFYLLQTDGLDPLGYARAFQIAKKHVRRTKKKENLPRALTRAMDEIVREALAIDGSDNITGVLAYVGDK